ncbi:hypothetical protein [uncultured Eudoraea sp.]|uniref:hypothetical protein n=1 Tax=uncultured Eudoraea sp. TaxID=1035614 RepID=UPI002636DC5D|nr:hypothetical protein [uncultured Eudoraea sp.]
MMDELELLKKDWQKKEEHHPKLSFDEIYKMIKKKSSSTVKWIFYISIIEFVFWAVLNLVSYSKESLELEKTWHVYEITTTLTIINYIVLIYFIYKFYSNYKRISLTESSKKLMKTILDVKRTVSQYVWFNIGIFVAYLLVSLYGNLTYGASSEKIREAASQAGNETFFWLMLIGMVLVSISIVLVLIWLFYKLLYGILLNRLRKNFSELKKLEV